MKKIILYTLTILLSYNNLFSQQYYSRRYQVESGLSNNTVFCSTQDNAGFMWFGTRDGLNRFDGHSFQIFRNDPLDSTSIGSNYIHSLCPDKNEILWVGTNFGLYQYNGNKRSFHLIPFTQGKDIRDIKLDGKGNLWLIMGLDLYRYNLTNYTVHPFNDINGISSIYISPEKKLWISKIDGYIGRYQAEHDHFELLKVLPPTKHFYSEWIEKIIEMDDGDFLIGTAAQGLKRYNIKTGVSKDLLIHDNRHTIIYVRDLLKQKPGKFWIGTESGIYIYSTSDSTFVQLQKQYGNQYTLSNNAVYTLRQDNDGGIWAGTYFGGLNLYPNQTLYFDKYVPGYGPNTMKGSVISDICADAHDNLWVGTEDDGLNKMNIKTRFFTNFLPSASNSSIAYSNIHGLLVDKNQLWIGTFEHGLDRMDIPSGKVIKHYTVNGLPHSLKSNYIICLCKTTAGKILIGTGSGLALYEPDIDGFSHIEAIASDIVNTLLEDHEGKIWVTTERHGVYIYNPKTGSSTKFSRFPFKETAGIFKVNSVFEDSEQRIWFATEGDGAYLYNTKDSILKSYNTQSGLPSNFVFKILQDNHQQMWMSTSLGLVSINVHTGQIHKFTKEDGLLGNQFNYNSAFKDKQGRLYFGGLNGLVSFLPDSRLQKNSFGPLYITQLQTAKKTTYLSSKTNRMELPYSQASFSLEYAMLNYTNPEKISYAYRMAGLSDEWTRLHNYQKAYFTGLQPGKYTFQVRASLDVYHYGPTTQLSIIILPPIWRSNLAYLFYVLLSSLIIYWLIFTYQRRQNEKNKRKMELHRLEKEKKMYQNKLEFFTHLTHEIKTPLTLIMAPVEDLIEEHTGNTTLNRYLHIIRKNTERLINMTEQLLDFRKTEIESFNLNMTRINITDILQEIFAQFESAASNKALQYSLNTPKPDLWAFVDEEGCKKILINLVSNAIKYADHFIQIQLLPWKNTDIYFVIDFSSDGELIPEQMREKIFEPFFRIGSPNQNKGTGIGLTIAQSIAILHNGELKLLPQKENLNTFRLTIPIKKQIIRHDVTKY